MYRMKLKEQNKLEESKKGDDQSTSATEDEAALGIDEKYWETNK